MILSVSDIDALRGSFGEALARELKNTWVRFFEMLAAGKNRCIDQFGQRGFGPEDRDLDGAIAQKSDFVALVLQFLQRRYRVRFRFECLPDLGQPDFDSLRQFFGCGLNTDASANVFYRCFDRLKGAI